MMRSTIFLILCLSASTVAAEAPNPARAFDLVGADGKTRTSAEWRDRKAIVVVFLGTECPVSNAYCPELQRLADAFGPKGVAFYGVHPDPDVNAAAAAAHAKDYALKFPVLLDPTQAFARSVEAKFTPEAVVLSPAGKVLYAGRIDDRWTLDGKRRDEARSRDLELALEAVLAGKDPPVARTKPYGCPLPKLAGPKGSEKSN